MDVEGDGETFEEYTWAGQTRIRATTMLEGGFAGMNSVSWREQRRVEGRKEMFYLTMHSTHFIYRYMVKDHYDIERGNPLPPHGLLFPINSKGSFICTIPQTG